MSSAVKMRVAALRILGATVFGAILATSGGLASNAALDRTIAVVVPIVADAGDGQLLTADELTAETQPESDWVVLANLARRHGFTVALDSRIVASIAALGSDAPETATTWLTETDSLDPLLLPWGNADVWALDPTTNDAFTAESFGTLAGVDPADLVVWPTGAVVSSDSVAVTASRGFSRMLVGDDQFDGGFNVGASAVLRDAVSPTSSLDELSGAASVRAALASNTTIVLPRNPRDIDVAKAIAVLDRVVGSDVRVTRVAPTAVNSTRVPRSVVAGPEKLAELMATFALDVDRAETMTDDSTALLATRIRSLATTVSDFTPEVFDPAANAFSSDSTWLSALISISLSTEYTVLSNTAQVPVSVSNASDATVTIDVHVRSTSGIVQVDVPSQSVTIEPRSNVRITVPMTAVANGRTSLVATLVDPAGKTIGAPVSFPIEVQAQWEILTIVMFFGSVIVIMTIGILRTIRRRRALA